MLMNATRGFGGPSRYIQGPGELNNLQKYTALFGKRVFMLIDVVFFENLTKRFKEMYNSTQDTFASELFGGEVTEKEIERVSAVASSFKPGVIVGIGGGKTLDTSKAVADNFHVPLIVVPTIASTDAPCSAMSVIYNEDGSHSHERLYTSNPNIVLVDSQIIVKAPVRFLVAGMGDALSTYFEARANSKSDSPNYVNLAKDGGYRRTKAAMALAKLCYDILLEDGLKAKLDAEAGVCTQAVENIIEANILLSGVGFENTGCAGAHSINNGITALPEGAKVLHGERVAYGVIVQLVAEGSPMDEIGEVIKFCKSVGLPITLNGMGIDKTPENIKLIAQASMHRSCWGSEPFDVTWENVYDAIMSAETLSKKLWRG